MGGMQLGSATDMKFLRCRHGRLAPVQGGEAGSAFEYGRLEIVLRGFWSDVCSTEAFTPDSAQVACMALGSDGGASLEVAEPFRLNTQGEVRLCHAACDPHACGMPSNCQHPAAVT